jgi:hypothetical protein
MDPSRRNVLTTRAATAGALGLVLVIGVPVSMQSPAVPPRDLLKDTSIAATLAIVDSISFEGWMEVQHDRR